MKLRPKELELAAFEPTVDAPPTSQQTGPVVVDTASEEAELRVEAGV